MSVLNARNLKKCVVPEHRCIIGHATVETDGDFTTRTATQPLIIAHTCTATCLFSSLDSSSTGHARLDPFLRSQSLVKDAQVTLCGGTDEIGMHPIGGTVLGATRRQELEDMNAFVLSVVNMHVLPDLRRHGHMQIIWKL